MRTDRPLVQVPSALARHFWDFHSRTWDEDRDDAAVAELLRWIGPPRDGCGDLVDLGCGTGRLSRALSGLGWNVKGIDFSQGMIQRAREKCSSELYVLADLNEPLQLDSCSQDCVVSLSVLQCLKEPSSHLREIARILRPEGRLFLTVKSEPGATCGDRKPAGSGVFGRIKSLASSDVFLRRFGPVDMERELLAAGLSPISLECQSPWLRLVARPGRCIPAIG